MQFAIEFVAPVLLALVVTSPVLVREWRRTRLEVT
jgi:hypothetical protein